jgi:hypothetical protein
MNHNKIIFQGFSKILSWLLGIQRSNNFSTDQKRFFLLQLKKHFTSGFKTILKTWKKCILSITWTYKLNLLELSGFGYTKKWELDKWVVTNLNFVEIDMKFCEPLSNVFPQNNTGHVQTGQRNLKKLY